ncbi:alanine dehydrogenase [Balneatrix alpica]|uniref:Alanine dehydrogenase n=1 Tax=Balneatrix alpica TaxID=75684 RepID=A0ABV5Z8M7_9GAMM|nr:alanine dehydrogenase [Balneatrix alpica]
MRIGVPKEIKNHEYRVGLTPAGVQEFTSQGHSVWVQQHAGESIGFSDDDYRKAGATLVATAEEVFEQAEIIIKVKEPQPQECRLLNSKHLLFTYLHLAADRQQTDLLLASGCTAVAYETVEDAQGRLPLLAPMSEVAGRMAIQAGAHCLEKAQQGRGVLLAGVPGVAPANVMILGGGVVGTNAARMALGMGANVTILDKSIPRLRQLDELYGPNLKTLYATSHNIEEQLRDADMVVGAVLVPGAAAPKLVRREHLASMQRGAVLVDVAIDQGGCFETSHATTHANPTYVVDGIVHYCVANMPGAVARTSTLALTNATLPYALQLANKGLAALQEDKGFAAGLNIHAGKLCHAGVGEAFNLPSISPAEALS